MAPKKNAASPATPAVKPLGSTAKELWKGILSIPEVPRVKKDGQPSDAGRVSTFPQMALLSSKGAGVVSVEALRRPYTSQEFNATLLSADRECSGFKLKYGVKPASTMLYALAKAADPKDLPPAEECTHAAAMNIWRAAQTAGLTADNASVLVFDFGLPMDEVLSVSNDRAIMAIQQLREARAKGQIEDRTKRTRIETSAAAETEPPAKVQRRLDMLEDSE